MTSAPLATTPPATPRHLVVGSGRARPTLVYGLMLGVGIAGFLYPFWFPGPALVGQPHAGDGPLWAAAIGALVVVAVTLELRRGTMNGATVAVLGVLAASAGLLRLVDLPGNDAGIFFLVILAGVAFGPRFGLLLGITAMATDAVITGGIGPWLPFQMLALGWLGGASGLLGRFTVGRGPRLEVVMITAFGWIAGFVYGAVMNLWSWPFLRGDGPTLWRPGLGVGATLTHYWSYYWATSFAWDAAGATCNAILLALTGLAVLRSLRRFAHRLEPVVELGPSTRETGAGQASSAREPNSSATISTNASRSVAGSPTNPEARQPSA